MRDCIRLKPLALRPTRWPAASPTRAPPRSTASSSNGTNFGSFCPAPASVGRRGARRGGGLAARGRVLDLAQIGPRARQLTDLRFGAVGRSVVDAHDLEGAVRE